MPFDLTVRLARRDRYRAGRGQAHGPLWRARRGA